MTIEEILAAYGPKDDKAPNVAQSAKAQIQKSTQAMKPGAEMNSEEWGTGLRDILARE